MILDCCAETGSHPQLPGLHYLMCLMGLSVALQCQLQVCLTVLTAGLTRQLNSGLVEWLGMVHRITRSGKSASSLAVSVIACIQGQDSIALLTSKRIFWVVTFNCMVHEAGSHAEL